jgi:hypothetical protein
MWAHCGIYQILAYVEIDGHPVSCHKSLVLRFLTVLVLGVSAKSQEVNISCVILSVRMEQFGSHWTDFREIWYLSIFRKSVEKIQVSLKSVENNGYFIWIPVYIYDISLDSS